MINNPNVNITSVELDPVHRQRIWKTYRRMLFTDLLSTFAIIGFFSMGFAYVIIALAINIEFKKLTALSLGIGAASLASIYLSIKEIELFLKLRIDLSKNKCERLMITASEAIAVDLPDGRHAIALNCGKHTLIILKSWWKNVQRVDIEWSPAKCRNTFPVAKFVMDRLPESGLVVGVRVDGERLKVKNGRFIKVDPKMAIPKYVDSYLLTIRLGDIK